MRWPDCDQWTPSLQTGQRLEPPAAAGSERAEGVGQAFLRAAGEGPGLLGCGHPANVENSQGRGCAICAAERSLQPDAGEAFIRLPSGEDVPLSEWLRRHPERAEDFRLFRESFGGLEPPPAELLRSLESRVAASARARSEHPWGASGRPSEAQLIGRILALEAELRARDFDIRGALALHQGGVQSLRRQLAEAAERADRAEHAVREHWTWGQYEFSQRRAPEIPGAGPAPEQAKDPA